MIGVVSVCEVLTAKSAKIAKTMLLQLRVLRGAIFNKYYILTAMAAAGSTPGHLPGPNTASIPGGRHTGTGWVLVI